MSREVMNKIFSIRNFSINFVSWHQKSIDVNGSSSFELNIIKMIICAEDTLRI